MKRGRLLVSVGCIVQLPFRRVGHIATPAICGAKESMVRLQSELFASDIHLVWVNESDRNRIRFNDLTDWLRHHGWMFERTGDLDLVGIDCIRLFDEWNDVHQFVHDYKITHAIVSSVEWLDYVADVRCQHILVSERANDHQSPHTWMHIERSVLNE